MENKGIIECPNCNQRIFADSNECPNCKFLLKEKENNFDKAIYDFLYYTYEKNRDKQETIKVGMDKFKMTMKEIKEMVDYASEEIYQKEESKKKAIQKEELPTNEVDYSKIKYNKRGIARSKNFPLKIIGIICYFIIILILLANTKTEAMQKGLFVAFMVGIIALVVTIVNDKNIPPSPHTFVYSFSQYFIHRLIYQIAVLVLVIWLPLQLENKIYGIVSTNKTILIFIYIAGIIALLLRFYYQFAKSTTSKFIVETGTIRYEHERIDLLRNTAYDPDTLDRYRYFTNVYYQIYSIKKVKETLNEIIIYGNIEKTVVWTRPGDTQRSKPKQMEMLKVPKIFKNNQNLIKALKICEKD